MSAQSPATAAAPDPASTTKLFFTIFPSIMLPMFLAVADQTIVATALPAIAGSLGDVEQITWIVISYLIATTIAAPIYGRFGDVFGRRRLMYIGLFIFMAASVLCALAPSVVLLSFARLLQGLGGGGLMTSSQALIGETIPPRERGRYQGYLAAVIVSSSTFGPVAGGYLTQHFGWQSVFLVNLPIGLVAALLMLRLPARRALDEPWNFDALGLVLFVLFVGPTLLAIELSQRLDASLAPAILGLAVCAIGALILLVRQERRAASPLLPISLLSKTAIWLSDALAACHGAALVSLITFLPLYLRVVRGASASESGFLLLPLTAGIGFGALVTGRFVSMTGHTFVFPSFGLIVSLATIIGLALFRAISQLAPVIGAVGRERLVHGNGDGRGQCDGAIRRRTEHAGGGGGFRAVLALGRRVDRNGDRRRRALLVARHHGQASGGLARFDGGAWPRGSGATRRRAPNRGRARDCPRLPRCLPHCRPVHGGRADARLAQSGTARLSAADAPRP